MLTEAEAKTKWCPMVRVAVTERDGSDAPPVVFNRTAIRNTSEYGTPHAAMCIGSACMMWRGEGPMEERYTNADDFSPADDGFQNTGRYTSAHRLIWERPRAERKGHCGLAGGPHE